MIFIWIFIWIPFNTRHRQSLLGKVIRSRIPHPVSGLQVGVADPLVVIKLPRDVRVPLAPEARGLLALLQRKARRPRQRDEQRVTLVVDLGPVDGALDRRLVLAIVQEKFLVLIGAQLRRDGLSATALVVEVLGCVVVRAAGQPALFVDGTDAVAEFVAGALAVGTSDILAEMLLLWLDVLHSVAVGLVGIHRGGFGVGICNVGHGVGGSLNTHRGLRQRCRLPVCQDQCNYLGGSQRLVFGRSFQDVVLSQDRSRLLVVRSRVDPVDDGVVSYITKGDVSQSCFATYTAMETYQVCYGAQS
jgi:hypothetical protein